MSSGMKEIVINTQERGISPDINRLQKMKGHDIAELYRYLFDVVGGDDDLNAGGVITEPATTETPLRAEIINGLMAEPAVATLGVQVHPGVLYALAPDGAADDSNYKFLEQTQLANLTMTAGAVATRIDVIECRPNPVAATVTDSRDIFNPSTGLFTVGSVVKETNLDLEFRVRLGIAGGGFPGAASGWTPLAVASVPSTALTNDDITFWDVRPLLNDREFVPFNLSRNMPRANDRCYFRTTVDALSSTNVILQGVFEAAVAGRRIGGRLRRGTPGTDAENVNIGPSVTDNFASGYAPGGIGSNVYVYLLCPGGLPRWARYTDAASGSRIPRSTRGIIAVTNTAPNTDGTPSAAIGVPASTGLIISTTVGLCFAATTVTAVGPTQFSHLYADGRRVYLTGGYFGNGQTVPTATALASTSWLLTSGTHFPPHAKALLHDLAQTANTNGAQTSWTHAAAVYAANSATIELTRKFYAAPHADLTVGVVVATVKLWLPASPIYPAVAPGHTLKLVHVTNFAGAGPPTLGASPFTGVSAYEF